MPHVHIELALLLPLLVRVAIGCNTAGSDTVPAPPTANTEPAAPPEAREALGNGPGPLLPYPGARRLCDEHTRVENADGAPGREVEFQLYATKDPPPKVFAHYHRLRVAFEAKEMRQIAHRKDGTVLTLIRPDDPKPYLSCSEAPAPDDATLISIAHFR